MNAQHLGLVVILGMTGACASVPRPQKRFETSIGLLTAAEAVGAKGVPKAALHLQYAREEVEKAKALMEDGDNESADYMLQRAEVDAKLAVTLGQNEPVRQKCAATKAELERVKAQNAVYVD